MPEPFQWIRTAVEVPTDFDEYGVCEVLTWNPRAGLIRQVRRYRRSSLGDNYWEKSRYAYEDPMYWMLIPAAPEAS